MLRTLYSSEKRNEKLPQEAKSLEDSFEFIQRARVRSSIKNKMLRTLYSSEREMKNYRKRLKASRIVLNLSKELEFEAQLKTRC
jgi:hypothetical protein